MKVLVAYATCHGSTAEIARRIASRLESAGDAVECRPVGEISEFAGYDAVVVGSAVHDQDWLAEAREFLSGSAASLGALPVWLFSVGMTGALPKLLQRWAMQEEDLVAGKLSPAVRPREHRLFSGVVRKEHLSPGGRAQFRLIGGRYGDFRDWAEIDGWASAIAEELHRSAAPQRLNPLPRGAGPGLRLRQARNFEELGCPANHARADQMICHRVLL